ncbi:hypothetical protein BpHYR1_025991 [Brachionus plicatilis]|uniref:Uncharacterized protein n=1 Tax=Brachionus plicatilis TaxID=10195 RepID=A0A3M7Q3B0_BRAPC|nr:hypothetical protein BpHYR1_025991 [Brachionus plicatilis]
MPRIDTNHTAILSQRSSSKFSQGVNESGRGTHDNSGTNSASEAGGCLKIALHVEGVLVYMS